MIFLRVQIDDSASHRAPAFCKQHCIYLLKRKTPLTLYFNQRSYKTKTPLTEIYHLSRTNNINTIRGATLIHRNAPMRLAGYQHIPGWITPACGVAAYSRRSAFPAPSVAHYDHLQFGPALSTPDSLDAHGDLYSHVIGLCCTVELLVGIIVTQQENVKIFFKKTVHFFEIGSLSLR